MKRRNTLKTRQYRVMQAPPYLSHDKNIRRGRRSRGDTSQNGLGRVRAETCQEMLWYSSVCLSGTSKNRARCTSASRSIVQRQLSRRFLQCMYVLIAHAKGREFREDTLGAKVCAYRPVGPHLLRRYWSCVYLLKSLQFQTEIHLQYQHIYAVVCENNKTFAVVI